MARLRALRLDELIPRLTQPVLGICLGMQLLFASSEEGEDGTDSECLGLIAERVTRFPRRPDFPVPHMGWNQVRIVTPSPLFDGVCDGDHFYFVHSYAAPLGPWALAATDYGGEFCAAARHGNFLGVQFHPERSAQPGARVLANFLELG
jgi:glutamine amidotransferase